MPQSKIIDISVGLFLLAGFIAFVVLALKISGLTSESWQNTYSVYARFENIGGLKTRSKVTIGGVTIGKVSDIQFDKERYQAIVTLDVFEDIDNLTTDTSAAILTAGLLGEKYIGLTPGADDTFLESGDIIEDTQSALILEEFIGRFLFKAVQKRNDSGNSSANNTSNANIDENN